MGGGVTLWSMAKRSRVVRGGRTRVGGAICWAPRLPAFGFSFGFAAGELLEKQLKLAARNGSSTLTFEGCNTRDHSPVRRTAATFVP